MTLTTSNGSTVTIEDTSSIVSPTTTGDDSSPIVGRPVSATVISMSPVLASSSPSPPVSYQPLGMSIAASPPNGVAMMSITTTPGMSPMVMPLAAPSPMAQQGGASSYPQQILLPSPVGQPPMVIDYRSSPVRPSVSGRPGDDLMHVENRAPSESIAQLFADCKSFHSPPALLCIIFE
jgi:hypothetical protein